MKKKLLSILILSVFCFSLGMAVAVNSADAQIGNILNSNEMKEIKKNVFEEPETGAPTKRSVQGIISLVINTFLSLLGVIFLVIIIYAGFLWMTAGGNDEQVGKAKKWLTNSIIGVAIIIAAYAISYFVLNALLKP